ncbi:MAG: DUF4350 domain-containing protein [Sphingomonadaceae bacterium]
MSAVAAPESGFNGKLMLILVGAAILSFVGFLFLSAYAPDMKTGTGERGHALSKSAIGFSSLVTLQAKLGRKHDIVRTQKGLETENLLVITPDFQTNPEKLARLIRDRSDRPTLIILPKRSVRQDAWHRGWVKGRSIMARQEVGSVIQPVHPITIEQHRVTTRETFASQWAPPVSFEPRTIVQTIKGDNLEPYITDQSGNILLAGIIPNNQSEDGETPVYILSDPDVMNNLGLSDPGRAWAAAGILKGLATGKDNATAFDVTLNGFETVNSGNSLLKLIFEPPFLALSLCLFIASLMALWHGLLRFGAPLRESAAFAPGKQALVDNIADLLRLAEREYAVGDRYAAMTRDTTAQALGLPAGMSADVTTARLDALSRDGATFSALAQKATMAKTSSDMLAAAQALFWWRKDKSK